MDKPTFVVHAYPVYIEDWRESETRMSISLEARGLLWELIFYSAKQGSSPTSPDMLRKIAACSDEEWERAWPAIAHCFEERGGRLHHARVDKELERMTDKREAVQKKAQGAAKKRWGLPEQCSSNAQALPRHTPGIAQPMPKQCHPDPNPDPNPDPDVCTAAHSGPSLAPLSAAEWAGPDPGQEARLLVGELLKTHPNPGNRERAVWSVQRVLAESLDIPRIMASIRTSHAAWCVLWQAEPKRFKPLLHKWVDDGDYMTTPAAPVSAESKW